MLLADQGIYEGKGMAGTFKSRARVSIYVFT